jgi:hypothetical protein
MEEMPLYWNIYITLGNIAPKGDDINDDVEEVEMVSLNVEEVEMVSLNVEEV